MKPDWKGTGRLGGLTAIAAGLSLIVLAFAAAPALAFGGGGGGGGGRSSSPPPAATADCPRGQYWSRRCGACAKRCPRGQSYSCSRKSCFPRRSGLVGDDDLYLEAVSLIESEHYREALDLLWAIEKREVPKVLNYIGYSTRKLGNVDEGIRYYKRALRLDPNYNPAREYLGEGYLQKGDLAKARRELAELETRCGRDCDAYEELAKAIAEFEARGATTAH